jgi:hypothetical protein
MMPIVMTCLTDNSRETSRAAAPDGRSQNYSASLILIKAKRAKKEKMAWGGAVTH